MAYAIGEFIYGWDLTRPSYSHDFWEDVRSDIDDDIRETHFQTSYSGNGDTPMWLGVTLGSIHEFENVTLEEVQRQAILTDELREDFENRLRAFNEDEEVPQALKDAIAKVKPAIWLLWGSS